MRMRVFFAMPVLAISVLLMPACAFAQTSASDRNVRLASAEKQDAAAKEKEEPTRRRVYVSGPNQGMLPSTIVDEPSAKKTNDKSTERAGEPVKATDAAMSSGSFSGRTVFGY